MSGWVDLLIATLILAIATGITLWMAGAIYYDIFGGGRWAGLVAAAWVGGVLVLFLLWEPVWQPFLVLLGVLALFLNWWYRQKPSQNRDWEPASAVLPRAVRTGDLVTIENVRNFEYRSLVNFTPRYETRTLHLANLRAVDVIFCGPRLIWATRCWYLTLDLTAVFACRSRCAFGRGKSTPSSAACTGSRN